MIAPESATPTGKTVVRDAPSFALRERLPSVKKASAIASHVPPRPPRAPPSVNENNKTGR